ncbi:MAG: 4-(cytidine 5'-diphospho)-2-C-methyl-D-erythritol kinase [Candidatus Lindowbacteria bacterium]|nr:4-(cytidine 5'-diphospho)-2-C-methyl-D-erythritol kinase [Candidatus Lindowbacteria bacterium]
MSVLKEIANAKVNLSLRVIDVQSNGFHDLEMLNICVGLSDHIELKPSDENSVHISGSIDEEMLALVPTDETNIAHRATALLSELRHDDAKWEIHIDKNIPVGAGLGGGSADAAAVLRLLDGNTKSNIELALQLGADVPYCVFEKPAIVRGVGEIIEAVDLGDTLNLVIVNPGIALSTKDVFAAFDRHFVKKTSQNSSINALCESLNLKNYKRVSELLVNDLEFTACSLKPELNRIKSDLVESGAFAAAMSGSGSSFFGLFSSFEAAEKGASTLVGQYPLVHACRSII